MRVKEDTSRLRYSVLALAAATFALANSASAQPGWATTHTKAHNVSLAAAVDEGEMQAAEQVHIAVSLQMRNQAEFDQLTANIMAGKAHPITPAEILARYAPTAEQAQAVADHLRRSGFSHVEIAPNRLIVTASGSHAAVQSAFNTRLHRFNVHGRQAFANVADVQVPASLAGTVLSVQGLQTVHQMHTSHKVFTPGLTPQASTYAVTSVSPTQFASIYSASSLPVASSATIGIITAGDMSPVIRDLKQFASNSGYPTPNVSTVLAGSAGTDTSGTEEWNMDSQVALATAGGTISSMKLYTATSMSNDAITAAFNKAVTDNVAKVINVSLGECETGAQSSGMTAAADNIFKTAVAQGQTFSVSSGDSGAYECGGTTTSQSYPSVSPYVMSIGGTTLSSSGGTWQGETVWSCSSSSTCPASASGGTGGGVSLTESAPSWQVNAGVLGSSTKRGVPDIAFDAAPSSGAQVLVNGSNMTIGGTSLAAPIFTGLWARVQASKGNSLPFPAQTLYAGASAHPEWFHDVTSGTNGGYSAKSGWDYTTGYGSLVTSNFATAFGGNPPPPPPPPPPGNQLLKNTSIESSTSWTASSGVICTNSTCSGETAHSGSGFAWMDGYGSSHTDSISQSVSIPSGYSSATLSFYLHIDTAETTSSTAYDKLSVQVVSGSTTTTVATYSNLNKGSGYALKSLNLSAYIGKSVTIKFVGTEDSSLQTSFVLDDVTLNVN